MDSGIEKPCSATKNGLTTLRLITGEVVEVKIPRDRKQLKTLRKDLKRGFSLSNSVDLDDPIFLGFQGSGHDQRPNQLHYPRALDTKVSCTDNLL